MFSTTEMTWHAVNAGADPAAATNTGLYNVNVNRFVKVTTLSAANRSTGAVAVRIGIDRAGNGTDTPGAGEWIYYDTSIPANSTLFVDASQGLWLLPTDDLVVYAATQNISFFMSGVEYA